MTEGFAVMEALGVRVREVRDLVEEHIWLPEDKLLLIDATLGSGERSALTSHLLAESCQPA